MRDTLREWDGVHPLAGLSQAPSAVAASGAVTARTGDGRNGTRTSRRSRRVADDLARSDADDLRAARGGRDALVAAAVTLTAAADHDPDVVGCVEAGCGIGLDVVDGGELCALADRLAVLPDAPPPPAAPPPVEVALTGFLTMLSAAADAVRACRQTAHASEGCWFSSAPEVDGCGEVLRLLHHHG